MDGGAWKPIAGTGADHKNPPPAPADPSYLTDAEISALVMAAIRGAEIDQTGQSLCETGRDAILRVAKARGIDV